MVKYWSSYVRIKLCLTDNDRKLKLGSVATGRRLATNNKQHTQKPIYINLIDIIILQYQQNIPKSPSPFFLDAKAIMVLDLCSIDIWISSMLDAFDVLVQLNVK